MKIIIKAIAGSHLFGTNTEKSDKDFKGVFIPSTENILLGDYKDTETIKTNNTNTRNTAEDIDIELYSLRKFLKMVSNGDTAALELLFTPESMILEKTAEWDYILSIREQLLSRSITAIIGYSRQQAAKYGTKGSRLGELSLLNDKLKEYSKTYPNDKIKLIFDELKDFTKNFNHINTIKMFNVSKKIPEIDGIQILGGKFDSHTSISVLSKWCSDKFKEYGQRAREAKNNQGIDYKALSHAVRVCFQAQELLTNKTITLPHSGENLKLLMDIKTGNYDFNKIDILLDNKLKEIEYLSKTSSLQERINSDFLKQIQIFLYLNQIELDKLENF